MLRTSSFLAHGGTVQMTDDETGEPLIRRSDDEVLDLIDHARTLSNIVSLSRRLCVPG
jgi:hypothetical protein